MSDLDGLVKSLHHVSVGVDGAQQDIDFMCDVLGFRFIKATVLFDGERPVYHLYYGDQAGNAGTVFTTFPWRKIGLHRGKKGSGQVKRTGFSAPTDTIEFWYKRLVEAGVDCDDVAERFGKPYVTFRHPSGLDAEIVGDQDVRVPWLGNGNDDPITALRGLHSVTLSVQDLETVTEFMELIGFRVVADDGAYRRLEVGEGGAGSSVDLLHEPGLPPGTWTHAIGLHHHFALRVDTEDEQATIKERLVGEGYVDFSEVKDRFYFSSTYVRSPAGVLIEFATRPTPDDPPGFVAWDRDEAADELGTKLHFPPWLENMREEWGGQLEPITLASPLR